MTDRDTTAEQLRDLVDASGFAFQLGIERLVESAHADWNVLLTEHAWQHPSSGGTGFIDAVLEQGRLRLVVECKRVRDGQWVFLAPVSSTRIETKWTAVSRDDKDADATTGMYYLPESPQSAFCTVRGSGENQRPMLERVASILVEATDALALEQKELDRRNRQEPGNRVWLYVPIVVTNAELFTCSFDPRAVNLKTGQLPVDAAFDPVTLVRFFKNLTVAADPKRYPSVESLNHARNRTALIANATGLVSVLQRLRLADVVPDVLRPFL